MIQINRALDYNDRLRKYRIMVDDVCLGYIKNGETKKFEIPPGRHRIYLKIDWCRSNELEFILEKGEKAIFDCGNATKWYNVLLYISFLKNKYLWLRKQGKEIIDGEDIT